MDKERKALEGHEALKNEVRALTERNSLLSETNERLWKIISGLEEIAEGWREIYRQTEAEHEARKRKDVRST